MFWWTLLTHTPCWHREKPNRTAVFWSSFIWLLYCNSVLKSVGLQCELRGGTAGMLPPRLAMSTQGCWDATARITCPQGHILPKRGSGDTAPHCIASQASCCKLYLGLVGGVWEDMCQLAWPKSKSLIIRFMCCICVIISLSSSK